MKQTSTFSQSSLTHWTLPDKQAKCSGVDPKWSLFCKFTPEYIRSLIKSAWPLYAAQCSAVSPLISHKWFFAPIPKRYAAVAVLPNIHAVIRGVNPLKSTAFTATPINSNVKHTGMKWSENFYQLVEGLGRHRCVLYDKPSVSVWGLVFLNKVDQLAHLFLLNIAWFQHCRQGRPSGLECTPIHLLRGGLPIHIFLPDLRYLTPP